MSKLNNVKYGLLMAAALLVASCNKSKDKNEKKNFQTEFEHQKEINGYNALAGEDSKCFAEYDQIDSIEWNNSLSKEILDELERSAAKVIRDADNDLKSLLNVYGVKATKDVLFSNYYSASSLAVDGNTWLEFNGAHLSLVEELAEQAGVSDANISKLGVNFEKISNKANASVRKILESVEKRYKKSHNIEYVENDLGRIYVGPEEINFAKISHADSVKIDSLWTIIKAKNELQKRKDSLSNAAWEAARKVCY